MAYSDALAQRVRNLISRERGFSEKRMFGGIGFLLHRNLCLAVWKDFLIVRVGLERYEELVARPFARQFDLTGRVMTGWVMVEPDGLDADGDLRDWVLCGVRFATSLPAKQDAKSQTERTPRGKRSARDRRKS